MHTAATTRPYLSRRQKRATGTTTSRINRKTRAGRAVQCRARFHDGRTLGQPSRPAEVTEKPGRSGRAVRCLRRRISARTAPSVSTKNPLDASQRHEKSADWGSSAMHCVIYISTTRPEFGRPTLAERSVYSKCVGPNNGLIVSLPRPP